MAAVVDRSIPVIFVDTEMLFTETLVYQQEVAERLHLDNVEIIRASDATLAAEDPDGTLHQFDTDACCSLRKTRPCKRRCAAMTAGSPAVSGSNQALAALDFFEVEDFTGRIKVNPLAHWAPEDVRAYMEENRLPAPPAGRARPTPQLAAPPAPPGWQKARPALRALRGQDKDECGIHFG